MGRPLMTVFWALILWGTLYAGLLGYSVLTEGASRTWRRAQSGHDVVGGVANLALAASAITTWSIVVGVIWLRGMRRRRSRRLQQGNESPTVDERG